MTTEQDTTRIPDSEMSGILTQAEEETYNIFEHPEQFHLVQTYCTRCLGAHLGKLKTWCVGNIITMESLCGSCWYKERIETLTKKWLEEHPEPSKTSVVRQFTNEPPASWRKPKLDLADFASIK